MPWRVIVPRWTRPFRGRRRPQGVSHWTSKIAVLPGDGIGPEVTAEGAKVLEAVGRAFGHRFDLEYADVGGISIDKHGAALLSEVRQLVESADAVLFGAVGGPKWDDPAASVRPEDAILQLRSHMGVFANLRPVKVNPGLADASALKPEILENVDMVVVRELTGGLYYAEPKGRQETPQGWTAVDTMRYTQVEIERILRVGFELSRERKGKLTSVDKANVLECSRLWRQTATRMAEEYPEVELEHVLVDICAMQLIQRPGTFDVIVVENTFGDILSDEASMLAASMGLLPLGQLDRSPRGREPRPWALRAHSRLRAGYRRPGHRQSHRLGPQRGYDAASLPWGLTEEAAGVERAVDQVLAQNWRTADIAPPGCCFD